MPSRLLLSAMLVALGATAFPQTQDTRPVVVIDSGHPSESGRGTKGKHSTEMQINFYVASLLATDLQRDGVKVIMTKNSLKLYLTNKRRALIANWAHANLFLRLHCDANSGSGFAVYYPGAPGVAADGTKGPSQHVINASRIAANKFHAGLVEGIAGELVDNGVKTDAETAIGAKQGALTGSIYSECPTVLVEMLTLTNLKDEKWIMNRRHPAILAHALEKGVLAALGENEQQ